ncbi:DUF885 domain-containing protein [Sphingomonas sp. ID1715]|uniref:DUF885 domain-containing protein n=1 Tax=Sphingomonas sp. ID1715 TaxID=1656898 RepID=UPI0014892776|nr:DUF885 domain-containing protein [Sphingomonas sp. ID1715]NNM77392.1 DUF885 domain-containing protein [Sphingomonas sp. ID1715]
MRLALLLASVALALPLTAAPAQPAAAAQTDANVALKTLFHDSDEAQLKLNPVSALFRGDMRYADRLGEFGTDNYYNQSRAAAESDLKRLHAIDRAKLTPTNQIAYDVFEWQTKDTLKGLSPEILPLTAVRPIDHFFGFHVFYPGLASGKSAAPFKTLTDYENNLKRHRDYIRGIDQAIVRFREGMASGVTQPKLIVNNVIDQLNLQINQGVEGSTFYLPAKNFPDAISAADQARLKTEYAAIIRDGILPAYVRLRDFLKNEYLPVAREGQGLVHMKGGDRLYAYLIESNTTLPMTADQIHNLGLSEVARIKGEMEAIKTKVGFQGALPQFFEYLRTDAKFKPKDRESYLQGYYDIGKRVDARIREQFSTIPKTPLEIRYYEPYREKTSAGGSYEPGSPDGKRPGVFYFNAYDLPSRSLNGMETLYLHEGAPGHHFQIALAFENTELPAFMRFGGNTAYAEGWGLYAESLYKELGMETDPYQRMGGLQDEMLRAMRLVVDSGIHAKGWTRDQAIEYMLANSSMSRTEATAEVERYIAIPGQALAYKVGQLTISRLKAKAQKELGAKFDPREFHAQVLMTGALPMAVLEKKIDSWIAAKKRA